MTPDKKQRPYTTVSIPFALMDKIDVIIESNKYGYASRTDFIYDSIRTRLRALGTME